MMNTTKFKTISLLLISAHFMADAQIKWGDYSNSSATNLMSNPTEIGLIVNTRNDNSTFFDLGNMGDYVHRLSNDPAFERTEKDKFVVLNTFDTAKVHFFLHGVDKNAAYKYQYRVLEYPNRTIVPWTAISKFTDIAVVNSSGFPQMPYLGGFRVALKHTIFVDVRQTETGKIISTAIVHGEFIKPIVTNIYTADNFDVFLKHLQSPWSPEVSSKKSTSREISVPSESPTLVFSLKAGTIRRNQIQYEVRRNNKVVIPWKENDYDNNFVWLKESRPGNYQLNIRYTVQPQHVASYQFKVSAAWYQSNVFKIAVGILLASLCGLFLFMVLLVKQKRLTSKEVANRAKIQLELKAIHAQLNPHFVFNALSSIQGLINKRDIEGANRYLVEFSKLMRESLRTGNNDEIPLEKEIEVLKTYINLEQLRFGFQYQIEVDEHINTSEINIPSLLLQPLIENAIKHGIGMNRINGKIDIDFKRKDDNLSIVIRDNGKGFVLEDATAGYGIKLTRERIQLLNALKPQQHVSFEIQCSHLETKINVTFNNWFL